MRTYKIVRFYRDDNLDDEVIKTGLTLEEAQAHCNDPTTRREGEWFDGYTEESRARDTWEVDYDYLNDPRNGWDY